MSSIAPSPEPYYTDPSVTIHHGDCIEVLRALPDASVDAVCTDPPYGLEFMGKEWDAPWKASSVGRGARVASERATELTERGKGHSTSAGPYLASGVDSARVAGRPFQEWCEAWARECLRVLKPGGHVLAFGGTRTWHRLTCAVEDAGFEIRDSIAWMYSTGFPKSMNLDRIKDSPFCRCQMGESSHAEDAESQAEHGLRPLLDADVPAPEGTAGGSGAVLLEGLPQQSSPATGRSELRPTEDGRGEPRMEGRRDAQASEGELLGCSVRPMPAGVPGDGPSGRLRHGTPTRHGSVDRSLPTEDGSREPQGSQPVEQREGEPRTLPVERGSQAWGGWPVCERCSQPVIPSGLGTALKPAFEPIVVARKPLAGTVAANVLAHGTGALNIDGCRTFLNAEDRAKYERGMAAWREHGDRHGGEREDGSGRKAAEVYGEYGLDAAGPHAAGRWPANVVLDESQAAALDEQSGEQRDGTAVRRNGVEGGEIGPPGAKAVGTPDQTYGGSGGASRFFYVAKADASERVRVNGTAHPTVKPLALMRWLVRLVTPSGGTVLEPFAGSGTTVEACILEGFKCIAIEREADYLPLIKQRIHRRRDPVEAVKGSGEEGGLFDLLGEVGA